MLLECIIEGEADPAKIDSEYSDKHKTYEETIMLRKVVRVIGETMMELKEKDAKWNGIPDIYYAHLIRGLAADNKISSKGDLYRMRYSEIRIENI